MGAPLILVVDDSPEIRQFLEQTVLRPAGYEVRSVADGLAAVSVALEARPDLLLTDQQLPGLTGIELIRRLRKDMPALPAILMSSEGSEPLILEAIRAGAIDFLSKPFEAEQLLAAVGRGLAEGKRWKALIEARTQAEENTARLQRRLRELEALAQIGRTVTSMLDLDDLLTTVVDAAVRLTKAEEGSLLLIDEASGELYMRASKNFDEDFARTFRLHVHDSLAGAAIESGKPVILDESSPQKIKTSYLVRSLIYVPLKVRGRTIGVLGVDNRRAGHHLNGEMVQVIAAMADYAAIAIENAQLYTRSEAERRKLETVLTQTENGVIVVDPDNRILLINRTACEVFGVHGDPLGRSAAEVLDHPRILALLREPGNLTRREELDLDDGRVLSAVRTPIQGVGQAVVMQDITHLKELDRIKSEFVTTVSHDLRSPLTAILGYVELIERSGPVTAQQKEFIRRVQASVQQITRLVTDLLDLGRIEAGLDSAMEKTPLHVLARYALETLRPAAETKGVTLEADVSDDLPMVIGDPIRLRQMIGNLIENAIKYTPPQGKVTVRMAPEGEQLILQVPDTGPGIPPADQPYLFDKFFRASNVPDDLPGTGLGLSIVKSIVDRHRGRIWVESETSRGTTFIVVLPTAGN
jgi:two-component system NtrC family sensor kinase